MATKTLNKKAHPKTSAADLLLMGIVGKKCTLEFDRQDEVFKGVLRMSWSGTWFCDASFESHWLTAIMPNDGSYTICVRIPDDEYAEMVAEFERQSDE